VAASQRSGQSTRERDPRPVRRDLPDAPHSVRRLHRADRGQPSAADRRGTQARHLRGNSLPDGRQLRPAPERQIDGGYVSYIATRKNLRAQGAGRALLSLAHADFIVNHHTVSRLVRLDPRHTAFFEAAGYQRTADGGYGDMHKLLDLSPESRAASQAALDGLWTLY
jgi:hypothetical protein